MEKDGRAEARRVTVKVYLTAGLLGQFDGLARQHGLSRSALIRQAAEKMLEDAEDVAVSEARLNGRNDPLVARAKVRACAPL